MANRNFNRFQALEKEVKALYADISIGAAGAPTLVEGLGIASVALAGTGLYTITLQDKYNRLMSANAIAMEPSTVLHAYVYAETVSTNKTLSLIVVDPTGAAVEPPSGTRLLIRIDVKNSSV